MSNKKTLLSLAVAASLGAVSLQASAAGPTLYGDIAVAFVYTGTSADIGAGSQSGYSLNDNVSLLGVKGEAAVMDGTKFIYDFNFILNQVKGLGLGLTHLSTIGLDGGFGTVNVGLRENGLFVGMVDGSTYQTNWFYTPGMSALQVNDAVTYKSKKSGGFQFGVQAFDVGKDTTSGESTTNYTVAGTYAMGSLSFGLGYTSYSDYADGTTQYGASTTDFNQFGDATNVYSGSVLKSVTGVSVGYKADKFGVVAAYDMRKPNDGNANTNDIKTAMVTASYAVSGKTTLVANYSNTDQSGGVKGSVITLMASYAPADNLFYSLEIQSSDKDANTTGLTGATAPGGTKSSNSVALGATYSF